MDKITIDELKKIAQRYKLSPCKVKGTDVVNIRKNAGDRYEDISWDEFEKTMKKHKLAPYKATESNFVKLMRDKK
jgi:hypothetical protein